MFGAQLAEFNGGTSLPPVVILVVTSDVKMLRSEVRCRGTALVIPFGNQEDWYHGEIPVTWRLLETLTVRGVGDVTISNEIIPFSPDNHGIF